MRWKDINQPPPLHEAVIVVDMAGTPLGRFIYNNGWLKFSNISDDWVPEKGDVTWRWLDEWAIDEEEMKNAYYAGFNQAHYSILHPELYKGEAVECVAVCEKWYQEKYLKNHKP